MTLAWHNVEDEIAGVEVGVEDEEGGSEETLVAAARVRFVSACIGKSGSCMNAPQENVVDANSRGIPPLAEIAEDGGVFRSIPRRR